MEHPHQLSSSLSDVFGDAQPYCRCMAAAVHALWPRGLNQYAMWLSQQEPRALLLFAGLSTSMHALMSRVFVFCNGLQHAARAFVNCHR